MTRSQRVSTASGGAPYSAGERPAPVATGSGGRSLIAGAPSTSAAAGIRDRAEGVGSAALIAALTLYAAFNAGGYFADGYGVIACALLLFLALRVAIVERPFAGWSRGLALPAAALALFACWSLLSLAWADAAGRTILEACRALPYLLTLVVFAASPWSPLRLRRAAGGIALAAVIVATAGLASRLAPDVVHTAMGIQPERLSFPLTYWNAVALMAATGLVICCAFASETDGVTAVRAAVAAALPGLAVTILLTYSRGGIAIAALMLVLYAVLVRPAGAVTTLLSTAVPTAIAVAFAYRADLLASTDPTSGAAAAQGHRVGAVLIACTVAAGVLQFLLVTRIEPRLSLPASLMRPIASRRTRWVLALVLAAVIAFPVARAVVHQVNGFSARPSAAAVADTRNRLSDPSSNGRVQYWRAALDGFRRAPVKGTGAGTYQFDWWHYRSVTQTVAEAHSLYLQTLGETGIVGLILVLAALLPLLAALVRRLRGLQRPIVGGLVACLVGWLIHAGLDWDWQMAAVTLWLFAVGGIALAQPAAPPRRNPLGLVARAALGMLLIAAAGVPLLAVVSQDKLDTALDAWDRGDCSAAVDAARVARAALPPRAEPRMVLGWCASRGGHDAEAIGDLRAAVARGGADWETHYSLALILAANGRDPRAQIADARRLNPLEPALEQLASAVGSDPRTWKRPALGASLFLNGLSYPPLSG